MRLISIYLFVVGWVSIWGLHEYVPIPMFVGTIVLIYTLLLVIKKREFLLIEKNNLKIIYLFLSVVLLSSLLFFNRSGYEIKIVTHALSYFGVILIYFFGVSLAITTTKYPLEKIYKYISWGVIFTSVITLLEFTMKNFLMIDVDTFVKRPTGQFYDATYTIGGNFFHRSRGTADESGHLALYLLMFSPMVIYYYKIIVRDSKKMNLAICIILAALATTFSAMGFAELILASIIMLIVVMIRKIKTGFSLQQLIVLMFTLLTSFLVFVYFFFYRNKEVSALQGIINKLTLNGQSSEDVGSRFYRWERAFDIFREYPIFGGGPGISSITYGSGSTSLYIEILIETGVVGLVLFLALLVIHLLKVMQFVGITKYVYLFSFIVMVIHFSIISSYFFPWIWTLLVMINIQSFYNKNRENKKIQEIT